MSIIKGGLLDRRGFLKTTAATAYAAPKRGGHLRVGKAHGQTTDTLNPGTWENGFTIGMAFAIHGFLTEVAPDGSVAGNLAESWEASDDAAEWRFKIRKGVTFHDGAELTPEDVVASINFHRGENSTSAAGPSTPCGSRTTRATGFPARCSAPRWSARSPWRSASAPEHSA